MNLLLDMNIPEVWEPFLRDGGHGKVPARAGCPALARPVLPYQLSTTNCCMSPLRRSSSTRLPVL